MKVLKDSKQYSYLHLKSKINKIVIKNYSFLHNITFLVVSVNM